MVPMEPSSFDIDAVKARVANRYGLKLAFDFSKLFREATYYGPKDQWQVAADKALRRPAFNIAPAGPGALNKLKAFGKHVGEFGREFVVGSPLTMAQQLKEHHTAAGGGVGGAMRAGGKYVKDFYMSPKSPTWMKALSLGVPAMELGGIALHGNPKTRKGDLAHAISGLVASPFTARLGLPGMALQGAVQSGARALASKFDHKPQPYEPDYAQLGPHARNVVRATGGPLNALNDIVPPDIDAAT